LGWAAAFGDSFWVAQRFSPAIRPSFTTLFSA
jgi:hypothetical protein